MTPTSKEILAIGHLGAGNVGDELMVEALRSSLAEHDVNVVALRSRRSDWMDPRPGVSTSMRNSWARWSRARTPLVLCGGTQLHDGDAGQRPVRNTVAMSLLVAQFVVAKLSGARVHLVAIGVGPLTRRSTRLLARLLVRIADSVTVRDRPSLEAVRSISSRRVVRVDDLAFIAPSLLQRRQRRSENEGCGDGVVVITVPDPHEVGASIPEAELVRSVAEALPGEPIVVAPLNRTDRNLAAATNLVEALDGAQLYLPDAGSECLATILDRLGSSRLVISARYHGVVAAGIMGIPCIAVPYHRKVSDVAEQFGFISTTGPLCRDEVTRAVTIPVLEPELEPSRALRRQLDAVAKACS